MRTAVVSPARTVTRATDLPFVCPLVSLEIPTIDRDALEVASAKSPSGGASILELDSNKHAAHKDGTFKPTVDEPARSEGHVLQLCSREVAILKQRTPSAKLPHSTTAQSATSKRTSVKHGVIHPWAVERRLVKPGFDESRSGHSTRIENGAVKQASIKATTNHRA